ncbi:uncharacterized protein cd44b isoform X2 [Brachyhypopomus gauderio]|uniref:uncharacterized protein cd44b isoform X2 n=1 Tax=Brachyhypopomus gauderio TaxID=698409 RepID=UPI0040421383
MWILLVGLMSGLLASSSWANSRQEVRSRSCSYVGVYKIEGADRYSLSISEAQEACEHLGATLASEEQMNAAYVKGFETCRYGWTSNGNIGILRHKANQLCAGNQTGHIIINATESTYDAYCYDGTDLSVKNCTMMKVPHTGGPSIAPTSPHTDTERPADVSEGGDPTIWTSTEPEDTTMPSSYAEDAGNKSMGTGSLEDTTEATQHDRGPVAEGPTKAHPWTRHPTGTTAFTTRGDVGGSGMGDTADKDIPDFSSEDGARLPDMTKASDENDEGNTVSETLDHTESPKWPLGADKGPSAEDKGQSGARNWLIIVGVVTFCFFCRLADHCGRGYVLFLL